MQVVVKYDEIKQANIYAKKLIAQLDNYISEADSVINTPAKNLLAEDSNGYIQTAIDYTNSKVKDLEMKKVLFTGLQNAINDVDENTYSIDKGVSDKISTIASEHVEKRKWYQAVGDWIYNTFCVDLVNNIPLIRDFTTFLKGIGSEIAHIAGEIGDWFKYGAGQYVLNIFFSVLGTAAAIVGAVGAICAIPETGGLTLPYAISALSAVASSVSAGISFINTCVVLRENTEALSLEKENPGAARYYGSVESYTDYVEKNDLGDKKANDRAKTTAKVIEVTEDVAEITSSACDVASLGIKRDYRYTKRTNHVNYDKNPKNKFTNGYSLSKENLKKNIRNSMGRKVTDGKYKKGTNTFFNPKKGVGAYTLTINNRKFALPKTMVKVFNGIETTNNVVNVGSAVVETKEFLTGNDITVRKANDTISSIGNGLGAFGRTSFINDLIISPAITILDKIVPA